MEQAAFAALATSPGLIATIFGSDDVVKYISKNISSLGYFDSDIIGSTDYCVLQGQQNGYYIRSHCNGCDIIMETIALAEMSNGDKVMLERIVSVDDIPKNKLPFVATHSLSKVPQEIVQDFVVNGSVGIHWVKPDGTIAWANQADMDICGYGADHYIGSSVVDYHIDGDVINDILGKLSSNQVLKEYQARLRHKDGSIRHVMIDSSSNFDNQGNFINTRCFTRDITEARELEIQKQAALIQARSAEEALKMKSLFLARMSHDIRTPLNGVMGMTSLLQTTELSLDQREFVEVIESSSSLLLKLIQDILDHSKIEAGKIELDRQPTNLVKLVNECASLLKVDCLQKDVILNIQVPSNEEGHILHEVDTNRMKQIVLNFLSNAVKFTTAGYVKLTLKITPSKSSTTSSCLRSQGATEEGSKKVYDEVDETKVSSDEVMVMVEDTGIGIEDATNLFANFQQATKSTATEYGGTGLGLSIAKSLTELMGGQIHLTSEYGMGTQIWCEFTFPRSQPAIPLLPSMCPSSSSSSSLSQQQALIHWKSLYHILVVEDNKINQKVLLNMLKKLGYVNIDVADNGLIAIEKFKVSLSSSVDDNDNNKRFDLILMDCMMPLMGGIEASAIIREMEANQKDSMHTPIFALTANAQNTDQETCFNAGMDVFITKPILIKVLGEEILKWTSTK